MAQRRNDKNGLEKMDRIKQALDRLYPKLPRFMAVTAVAFYKSRFVEGKDINNKPFAKRSGETDDKKNKKKKGRAVLVKRGVLKRDVRTNRVTAKYAIVGTTQLTVPYAKANNEGVNATVEVKGHKRGRYKKTKEKYTDKKGIERGRSAKVATGATISVGTHRRKMDLPKRQFMGISVPLEKRLVKTVAQQIIRTIKKASS